MRARGQASWICASLSKMLRRAGPSTGCSRRWVASAGWFKIRDGWGGLVPHHQDIGSRTAFDADPESKPKLEARVGFFVYAPSCRYPHTLLHASHDVTCPSPFPPFALPPLELPPLRTLGNKKMDNKTKKAKVGSRKKGGHYFFSLCWGAFHHDERMTPETGRRKGALLTPLQHTREG